MANSYELVNISICFPMYTEANELLSSLNGVAVGNLIFDMYLRGISSKN